MSTMIRIRIKNKIHAKWKESGFYQYYFIDRARSSTEMFTLFHMPVIYI